MIVSRIFLVVAALCAAVSGAAAQSAPKPNIVVIMTDDQTMADLVVMSKTLTYLGDNGVTFTNSFTDFPLCCPSRVTFLTGQASNNHGILGNNAGQEGGYPKFRLTEDETLPVWLQRAGFTTFYIGKYMNGYGGYTAAAPLEEKLHVPPGWNQWFGKPHYTGYRVYDYDLNENGTLIRYGCNIEDYETDVINRKATDFIAGQADKAEPFFMWIAPLAPHTGSFGSCANFAPYLGPKPAERHRDALARVLVETKFSFNEANVADKPSFIQALPFMTTAKQKQTKRRATHRRESLLAVDEMVEDILLELIAAGKDGNTCLIFTSDNGYLTGEHRVLAGKLLPYEESIRVPLIISCPGMPTGESRSQLVTNVDLAATIVDLAGATPGRTLDGKSLLPIIEDAAAFWRAAFVFRGFVVRPDGDDEDLALDIMRYEAVRSADAKYVEYSNGEKEFYHFKNDADETLNRMPSATSFVGLKARMKTALDALRDCVGNGCWMATLPSQ